MYVVSLHRNVTKVAICSLKSVETLHYHFHTQWIHPNLPEPTFSSSSRWNTHKSVVETMWMKGALNVCNRKLEQHDTPFFTSLALVRGEGVYGCVPWYICLSAPVSVCLSNPNCHLTRQIWHLVRRTSILQFIFLIHKKNIKLFLAFLFFSEEPYITTRWTISTTYYYTSIIKTYIWWKHCKLDTVH